MADAVTIWSVETPYNANLEMRYSERCHSNWVRFTPQGGIRGFVADGLAGGNAFGYPWIWREASSDAPRGVINQSGNDVNIDLTARDTRWTAMVSADGRTCMSVDEHTVSGSASGLTEFSDKQTFDAGCTS